MQVHLPLQKLWYDAPKYAIACHFSLRISLINLGICHTIKKIKHVSMYASALLLFVALVHRRRTIERNLKCIRIFDCYHQAQREATLRFRRIMRSFWVLKNNHSAGAEHWSSVKCSNVFKNPQVGRKIVRWLMAFLVTQNWSICAFRFSSLTQWIQFPNWNSGLLLSSLIKLHFLHKVGQSKFLGAKFGW